MAKIQINIKKDYSPEILATMKDKVQTALKAMGVEAEGYAKDECPVDTGRLRNSISNKVISSENAVYIGTNVEYGVYVEYGDYNHVTGKKHFLKDAAANHGDHYKAILEAALKK